MKKILAFSLTELLIVLAILALLAAILLPVLSLSKNKGYATACINNEKMLVTAVKLYQQDYDGFYPPVQSYNQYDLLGPYRKSVLICPSVAPKEGPVFGHPGYAMNTRLMFFVNGAGQLIWPAVSDESMTSPSRTILWTEQLPGVKETNMFNPYRFANPLPKDAPNGGFDRHFSGSNVAFADGHVKWHTESQVEKIGETPEKHNKPTFYVRW